MSITKRAGIAAACLAASLALAAASSPAQESPAPAPARPAATRTYDPARRVPPYFGQVNLTTEQKESIYKIRARHQEQIDSLQRRLDEARAAMLAECEAVLSESQKQRLEERRRAANTDKKGGAAKPPAASASESARSSN